MLQPENTNLTGTSESMSSWFRYVLHLPKYSRPKANNWISTTAPLEYRYSIY